MLTQFLLNRRFSLILIIQSSRIMRFLLSSFFLAFSSLICFSQFEYNTDINVFRNGSELLSPWAGGLNHVQISDFDIDFDGDMDLFIFDVSSNNIRVYLHEQNAGNPYYALMYNAQSLFPSDIIYKGIMVDYDNDGRKDLWTYGLGGLKVYRNIGDAINGIQWQLEKELIYSEYLTGTSPLIVLSSDMPAISDIDNDGDIDILTFHSGGQNVEYHKNQSMELYGIPDSLVYELKNECWGQFRESSSSNVILLNDIFFPCSGSSISNPENNNAIEKMHPGSSLLAIDMNNSGVSDLILGDAAYSTLTLLMNEGVTPNTNSAMYSQDNSFPSNNIPVDVQLFPVAFYVDVDFDNLKDLIVGTNVRNLAENESSIWFYKNIGSNSHPNFSFQRTNLFQNEMIEHGTGSMPVFFDEDEDGLKDLLVANFHRYIPNLDKESTIALYRNTGGATNPEFTYIDYDYLNLSQGGYGLRLAPTFGDIDADGDEDMFVGTTNGTLMFFENTSIGSGAIFNAPQIDITDNLGNIIDPGLYSFPQLFDLDNDGLLDLIVGVRTGELYYYQNIGTVNAPIFELMNSMLGQVDVSGVDVNGYSAPHFYRKNDTTFLLSGAFDGRIHYYDNIDGNLNQGDAFNLVSNTFSGIDVDAYSSVLLNDIDNDGNYNLFIGQELGGIFHFIEGETNTNSTPVLEKNILMSLYPNPTSEKFTINTESGLIQSIKILDVYGKVIYKRTVKKETIEVNSSNFSNGIYVVEIRHSSGQVIMKRFIKK